MDQVKIDFEGIRSRMPMLVGQLNVYFDRVRGGLDVARTTGDTQPLDGSLAECQKYVATVSQAVAMLADDLSRWELAARAELWRTNGDSGRTEMSMF